MLRALLTFWIAASIVERLTVPEKLKIDESDVGACAGTEERDGVDRERFAVVGADLEGDRAGAVEQADAVERGLGADVGDLGAELGDFGGDCRLVGGREGAVVELDGEVADALEHGLHLGEGAFTGLYERDGVLAVALGLVEAADLGLQLLGDREAGSVVGGAVDPEARGEPLHRRSPAGAAC